MKNPRVRAPRLAAGFTLVEIVVVIVITGIIAGVLGVVIVAPMQGYDAQARRAALVDNAEGALRRMQRDVRQALPNSVRIDATGRVLEVLSTVDGGRYCASMPCTVPPTAPGDTLRFNTADTDFDVIGKLSPTTVPLAGLRLVVYNLGQPGGDAYAGTDVITPAATTVTITAGANDHITMNPGFQFRFDSPSQRFFLVDTPVTYLCDPVGGTLTRYAGYGIDPTQPTNPAAAPLSGATSVGRVAGGVTACQFTYQSGASERAGVVTLALTVADAGSGEQVRLLHQVHVYNTP